MLMEKNGVRYLVTDQAHIDCFKAKGWVEVQTTTAQKSDEKPVKKAATKKN